jgi:hypothetical protein
MSGFTLERIVTDDPEYTIPVFFEPVKTIGMMNDQKNHQGCTDANGKTKHIDDRKDFVASEIPECDNQPVFEHMTYLELHFETQGLCHENTRYKSIRCKNKTGPGVRKIVRKCTVLTHCYY